MFIAEERNEITPVQLLQFLTTKPPVGAAVILRMKPGCVLIAVGKRDFDKERFTALDGVPLFVVTDDLTADQWQQMVTDGQHYFATHGPVTAFQLVLELKNWLSS